MDVNHTQQTKDNIIFKKMIKFNEISKNTNIINVISLHLRQKIGLEP